MKMPERLTTWLLVLLVAASVTTSAVGQDDGGFVFEEEDVQQVAAPATPVARFLQEGIQYFNNDDFVSASIFFWRVVNEEDVSADGLRPRAQYELAKTLVQMRLLQGALYFFDEIIAEGAAHPYFEASAPWLVVIARRLPGDTEMLRRVAAFADVFPDRIEEKYRDEMAYMLGQHFYNVGELERSLQYLDFVTEVSPYYPRALFLSGITHIRRYDAQPAVARFISLMRLVEDSRGSNPELEALGELARLSMARTFYSTGEYDKSVDYYAQIEQGSAYWLDSLFESSWAYFQLDDYNRGLGNLHSLNSPFFNDEYYPEAPILQAVTLFYNCRFREVRATIEEFEYVYDPLRDELQELIGSLQSSTDYYDFVRESEGREGRNFDPRLAQILDATLSDRSVVNSLSFIDELGREIRFIDNADPGWANSDLASYLYGELIATRDLSIADAGELVESRLSTIYDELSRLQRDANAILVETDLAEANALSSDVAAELFTGEVADTTRRVHPEQMFWTFDGEYWKDELGYYYYHITSACQ